MFTAACSLNTCDLESSSEASVERINVCVRILLQPFLDGRGCFGVRLPGSILELYPVASPLDDDLADLLHGFISFRFLSFIYPFLTQGWCMDSLSAYTIPGAQSWVSGLLGYHLLSSSCCGVSQGFHPPLFSLFCSFGAPASSGYSAFRYWTVSLRLRFVFFASLQSALRKLEGFRFLLYSVFKVRFRFYGSRFVVPYTSFLYLMYTLYVNV